VDSNTVHVSVVDEPDDLVGEQVGVILAVEVGLRGLTGIQLKILADTCVTCWISLHDLGHDLLDQKLHAGEPVAVCRPDPCRS